MQNVGFVSKLQDSYCLLLSLQRTRIQQAVRGEALQPNLHNVQAGELLSRIELSLSSSRQDDATGDLFQGTLGFALLLDDLWGLLFGYSHVHPC